MALDFVYKEYYYSTTANKNKINNKPGVDESLSPDFSEANIKSNLKKLHTNVYFFMGNFDDEIKDKFSHLKEGEVILIENIIRTSDITLQEYCNIKVCYNFFSNNILIQ